jgi:alpha-aminoadipic semialdehyde synthase
VDNLPAELPKDASEEFSSAIRDYVYQVAAHGVKDITHHIAIPAEIRRAVITQNGKLTKNFSYLRKYMKK